MGNKERLKGMRGELMLRDIFRNHGYDQAQRGSVFTHTSDVIGLPGIHVECKFVEKLNVRKAMAQAEEEAIKRKDGIPVVFHKTSREPWLVTMRIHEWMELYKVWEEMQRNGRTQDVHQQNNGG